MVVPTKDDPCQRGREPVIREDGSIEIPLTQGRFALVDAASYALVRGRTWCAWWHPGTRGFYAVSMSPRRDRRRKTLLLHREVLRAQDGVQVDHRNHDTLDNRLNNLRLAIAAENSHNMRRPRNNTSGYKGVSWNKDRKRWQAHICLSGKRRYLGYFDTAAEAGAVYDAAARKLHGAFAFTNEMAGLPS
jgi:hypothetical protein